MVGLLPCGAGSRWRRTRGLRCEVPKLGSGYTRLRHGRDSFAARAARAPGGEKWSRVLGKTRFDQIDFFARRPSAMLLRFAVLVGGTHKARIIAILLVLHFGLAALNHFIEIGEIERDRQSLEAQFPDLGVACYDYIPWLIALSVTIFFAIGETFGVGFLWYLPEVVRDDHPRRFRGFKYILRIFAVAIIIGEGRNLAGVRCHFLALRGRLLDKVGITDGPTGVAALLCAAALVWTIVLRDDWHKGGGGLLVVSFLTSVAIGMALELGQLLLNHVCCKCCPCLPRTVNGTGHTGPSEFCATSI